MSRTRTVLVVSDFPIIRAAADSVFAGRCTVRGCSWSGWDVEVASEVDVLVLDITNFEWPAALLEGRRATTAGCVAFCSLHWNQVIVYRSGPFGFEQAREFPSLFELAA
ncbi:MAG TPA: hypothetical protein VF221_09060 [Chloroflexota bacterium]